MTTVAFQLNGITATIPAEIRERITSGVADVTCAAMSNTATAPTSMNGPNAKRSVRAIRPRLFEVAGRGLRAGNRA